MHDPAIEQRPDDPRDGGWAQAGIVVFVALVVRLWTARSLLASDPTLSTPILDDAYYLELARRMVSGEAGDPFLAPLYPWVIAQLGALRVIDVSLLCSANAMVGGLTSGLVALAARRLQGPLAGWIAGGLHALAGVFVFHDALPGQEPLLGLLHAAVALCAVMFARNGKPVYGGAIGLLSGLAVLGRATSGVLLLAALPGLRQSDRRGPAAVLCVIGFVVALVPSALHNHAAAETLSPLPWSGGANLYLANGPDARANISMMSMELGNSPLEIERNALAIASAASGRELTTREASAYWVDRTKSESSFGELSPHVMRKLALFLSAEERGSNHDARVEREFAPWTSVSPISAWWILVLGIAGWALIRHRLHGADAVMLPVIGTWLALAVAFPVPRYRLPAAVLCVVLVGAGIAAMRGAAKDVRESRRRRAAAIVALALGVVAFLPIRAHEVVGAHINIAVAAGRTPEGKVLARRHLELAVESAPEHGPARELLGRLLLEGGDHDGAVRHFEIAAQDERSRISVEPLTIVALVRGGKPDDAWRIAQGLVGQRLDDAELLAAAALAAKATDRRGQADTFIRRAVQLAPRNPVVVGIARELSGQ